MTIQAIPSFQLPLNQASQTPTTAKPAAQPPQTAKSADSDGDNDGSGIGANVNITA